LATLLVTSLFLWQELTVSGTWGFPLDDTWIHMQFARNISTRGEFAFNMGEPIAASTAPLWTLLLAVVYTLFSDVVWATKAVGVLLLWTSGALTVLLAREVGLGTRLGLLAGIVVVITPRLVWGSLSGMEVMLYTTLSTAGIWLHIRSLKKEPSLVGTVCFALASLARPECVLLFPLAILDRWLRERNWQQLYRCYRRHVVVFGLVLLPSVVFNFYTLGKPLPNTFYAKVGPYGLLGALSNGDMGRVVKVLFYYPLLQAQEVAQFGLENQFFIACLVPFGLLWFFLRRESQLSMLIPLILISFPLFRGVLAPFQGALFQHGRYAAHLIPLMTVAGLGGGLWVVQWVRDSLNDRYLAWAFGSLVLGSLMVMNTRCAQIYGQDVENIEHMHVKMGQWLAKNTPEDAVLATHDIGAIGYFSGRRVLDTVGLVTPEVLPFLRQYPSAAQGVWAFLNDQKPDYVIMLPNWYPELSAHKDVLKPIYDVQLGKVTIAAGQRMVVYRPIWKE
jgi:arabinofuranosyltransferase